MIVTELCSGSLNCMIQSQDQPWKFPEFINLITQIAQGMRHLHRHSIIHRDLKPANVLVQSTMSGTQIKIADFGLAREMGNADEKEVTMNIGTPAFLAPEVFSMEQDSEGKYTSSVDVYSFGVVCWSLWVRNLPWKDVRGIYQLIARVSKGCRPVVPEDMPLKKLVTRCWHANPEKRPTFEGITSHLDRLTAQKGNLAWGQASGASDGGVTGVTVPDTQLSTLQIVCNPMRGDKNDKGLQSSTLRM